MFKFLCLMVLIGLAYSAPATDVSAEPEKTPVAESDKPAEEGLKPAETFFKSWGWGVPSYAHSYYYPTVVRSSWNPWPVVSYYSAYDGWNNGWNNGWGNAWYGW